MARPEQFQNADPAIKAELKIGKNVCQCTGCEAFFTGPSVFDRHLYLTADNEAPPVCLSPAEMRAIGMTQNVHGVWQYGVPKKLAGAA